MTKLLDTRKGQVGILLFCWVLFSIVVVKPWQLYFLNDDFMHIPDARLLLRSGFMRPVPNYFLWLDKTLYGTQALGYHITTQLLHGATVLAVYFAVGTMQGSLRVAAHYKHLPLLSAFFFLCSPYHAESLMWPIARVSIMATGFTLLSLMYFMRSNGINRLLFWSWVWLVVALFSYESMWNVVLLYLVVAAYKYVKRMLPLRVAIWQGALMCFTFLVYMGVRFALLQSFVGNGYEDMEDRVKDLPLVAGNLIKLVGRVYTPAMDNSLFFMLTFAGLTLIFALISLWIYKVSSQLGKLTALLWLAIVTGVLTAAPLGIDTHFHESDRYTYYASFYFCLFLALVCVLLPGYKLRFGATLGIVAASLWLISGLQRDYAFSSSVTRGTVQFVKGFEPVDQLVFVNVPERYKGALIFRTSLADAIHWISPEVQPDSLLVVSQVRNFEKVGAFRTGTVSAQAFDAANSAFSYASIVSSLGLPADKRYRVYWYGQGGLWHIEP